MLIIVATDTFAFASALVAADLELCGVTQFMSIPELITTALIQPPIVSTETEL